MSTNTVIAFAIASAISLAIASRAHADTWSAYDVGAGQAYGLNDLGQVVGYNGSDAFVTGADGVGLINLGRLGGSSAIAYGINRFGQVVGGVYNASGNVTAFITGANAVGVTYLGALGGFNSFAYGINSSGRAVGFAQTADNYNNAFITGANGSGMTSLGTLGGLQSGAYGINDSGQVVGYSNTVGGNNYAFVTRPNGVGMTSLGLIGQANRINNLGQVVGFLGSSVEPTFITGVNGVGVTVIDSMAYAYGINDLGQLAGTIYVGVNGNIPNAAITGPNGVGLINLNSLVAIGDGAVLTNAFAINNSGQVIANASNGHAYLLTNNSSAPVPEPGKSSLMGLGLTLLLFVIKHRKTMINRMAALA